MVGSTTKTIIRFLSVFTLVLSFSGSVLADPPPAPHVVPPWSPCNIPPVWGKTYPLEDRFVPVLGGLAFCDQATGVVWEASPDPNTQSNWAAAYEHCLRREVGDEKYVGFQLPSIVQLGSLVPLDADDLNADTGDGPFKNVVNESYWSRTEDATNSSNAWRLGLASGNPLTSSKNANNRRAWCVLGE